MRAASPRGPSASWPTRSSAPGATAESRSADYWRREMRDLVAQRLYDTPDCVFVEPHAPYRPCGIPVRRLHIDPRERSPCRPYIRTALLEGTEVQARRRTRVREDHPERTRQAARQACRSG